VPKDACDQIVLQHRRTGIGNILRK